MTLFLDHANEAEPRLDAMLFALASEFRPTSRHDAEGTLDHLAMRVTPGAVLPAATTCWPSPRISRPPSRAGPTTS